MYMYLKRLNCIKMSNMAKCVIICEENGIPIYRYGRDSLQILGLLGQSDLSYH